MGLKFPIQSLYVCSDFSKTMIKALLIAAILIASGGAAGVYAQPSEHAGGSATPAMSAPPAEAKKTNANATETKREELGQKLMKRKMELNNERLMQPLQPRDRAHERRNETPADTKGQKK